MVAVKRIHQLASLFPFVLTLFFGTIPLAQAGSQDGPTRCRNEKGEMEVIVREKDKKVMVEKGEILVVKLPARLGTGYGWQVVKNDKSLLKLDGEPLTEDIPSEDREKHNVGGTEYQVFRFLSKDSGEEELKMEYRRSFEEGSKPRKTYKVDVKINKS
jgi:predicted secreted protein